MLLCFLALLGQVKPITPMELNQAMLVPVRGAEADELAKRIRASFPAGTDLKLGKPGPLVRGRCGRLRRRGSTPGAGTPRVAGMVNHGRGLTCCRSARPGSGSGSSRSRPTPIRLLVPAGDETFGGRDRRDAQVEVPARVEGAAGPDVTASPCRSSSAARSSTTTAPARSTSPPPTTRRAARRADGLPGRRRLQERACRDRRRQPDRRPRDAGDDPACCSTPVSTTTAPRTGASSTTR